MTTHPGLARPSLEDGFSYGRAGGRRRHRHRGGRSRGGAALARDVVVSGMVERLVERVGGKVLSADGTGQRRRSLQTLGIPLLRDVAQPARRGEGVEDREARLIPARQVGVEVVQYRVDLKLAPLAGVRGDRLRCNPFPERQCRAGPHGRPWWPRNSCSTRVASTCSTRRARPRAVPHLRANYRWFGMVELGLVEHAGIEPATSAMPSRFRPSLHSRTRLLQRAKRGSKPPQSDGLAADSGSPCDMLSSCGPAADPRPLPCAGAAAQGPLRSPCRLRGARTAPGGIHPSVAQACAGFYAGLLSVARGSAHAFGAPDTPRPALA